MFTKFMDFKKLLQERNHLFIINLISGFLMIISLCAIGYLEATDISVVNFNIFKKMTRKTFLERNAAEIESSIYDGKSLKLRTAQTEEYEGLSLFTKSADEKTVFYIRKDDKIVIICKSMNYREIFDKSAITNLLSQYSNIYTFFSEKATFYQKLNEMIESMYETNTKYEIPNVCMLFYDESLGTCAMKSNDETTASLDSEESFYEYALFKSD